MVFRAIVNKERIPKMDIFAVKYETEIRSSFLSLKGRLFPLILGAYQPDDVHNRLIQLKVCLRNLGYNGASLVEDFKDPPQEPGEAEDEYIARKSLFWIDRADILLFVFFRKGKNEGVAVELGSAASTLMLRSVKFAIFYELKCEDKLSRMITGIARLASMNQYHFNNDKTLCKRASIACFEALREIYPELLERTRT